MAEASLKCRICGVEVILSTDQVVRGQEVAAFVAAHNSHDEGVGVEMSFTKDDEDTA